MNRALLKGEGVGNRGSGLPGPIFHIAQLIYIAVYFYGCHQNTVSGLGSIILTLALVYFMGISFISLGRQ
jgi:hypothetical protein